MELKPTMIKGYKIIGRMKVVKIVLLSLRTSLNSFL
jgi:hypothetical protein